MRGRVNLEVFRDVVALSTEKRYRPVIPGITIALGCKNFTRIPGCSCNSASKELGSVCESAWGSRRTHHMRLCEENARP